MNWEAIGAVGETVGAVAVIVTLIYLAMQVRYLRRESQSEGLNQLTNSMNEFAGLIAESETLSAVIAKGRRSFDELTEPEKLRFAMIHYYFLNVMENWYARRDELFGVTPSDSLENLHENIRAFCAYPGFIEFWRDAAALYPGLSDVVDEVLSERGQSSP